VGHEDHGLARRGVAPDVENQVLKLGAVDGIERSERFVHQQHRRAQRQRARNSPALLHAAGKFEGMLAPCIAQPDHVQILFGEVNPPLLPHFRMGLGERKRDVLRQVEPRKQRIVLEDDAALDRGSGDWPALPRETAGGRLLDARQQTKQRGLTAPTGAQQADELAFRDR
jgi:hypothetical protein